MNEKLPYTFHDEERSISFEQFDLPSPWINYLSNGRMHAFVSHAGGGMLWWLSPMVFRITRYRFYNLPTDTPGFYAYIRMKDGTVWAPTFTPCETQVDERSASHAPGYSVFEAKKDGLRATIALFMAQDYDTLLWNVKLSNEAGENLECDVFAYAELSQFLAQQEFALGYYLKWNTRAVFDEDMQAITYAYTAWMHPRAMKSPLVYFGSSEKTDSYCCNRDTFCGNYRDEKNPVEPEHGQLSNTDLNGGEPCAALHSHIVLEAGEQKTIHYYLGVTPGALADYEKAMADTKAILSELRSERTVEKQFDKCKAWWEEHLNVMQVEIPDADAMRQINTWNPVQSVHTGRYSRSISSSASGVRGIGFRDSAQDMLAQAYRKPEWALDMLKYLASLQLEDGHPVHIAWPEENKPAQDITRSDNHLWMIYLAHAIVAETGKMETLEEKVPFLATDLFHPAEKSESSLWEHMLRAISFTENHIGEHGLPLILFSDWNDHIGPFGRKGKGESIMVSEQYIYALRQMSDLARLRGEQDKAERFDELRVQQEEVLAKYAWDGEWYLRAIDDDGKPVGTHTEETAKIWLNTQSWMIIADAGEREKQIQAMDSAKRELDTGLGLLLNVPSFPGWPEAKDSKVNGLPAGYSENGGVFCQANCWAIMAEALLGRGDRAWQYYLDLIPHNLIKKIGVEGFHSESYAYCSTLLGTSNERFGWGCVSQVTGTAAWMDVVATQYLLGVRPTLQGLLIDPAIPSEWDSYTIERIYRGCKLNISVENPTHVQSGVKELYINEKTIDISNGAYVTEELLNNCEIADVKVIMG